MRALPDLGEPSRFPFDYDDASDEWLLATLTLDQIGGAAFLDARMGVTREDTVRLADSDATLTPLAEPPAAFLFHTAFCGSTLLARALDAPPRAVALKEPLVLTTMTRLSLQAPPRLDALLDRALKLLGRPWAKDGAVLVKPTNLVNRIAPRILALAPGSRAILMHASLREFLVSCFKKLPQAEVAVRWMAQTLVRDTTLAQRLGLRGDEPYNLVEACVLTWHAQLEVYARLLGADARDHLRTLDMATMLERPAATVAACARFVGLDAALDGLETRVAAEFSRDSKKSARDYDAGHRAREKSELEARYGEVIEQALAWSRDAVAPHAILPRDWKPLAIE